MKLLLFINVCIVFPFFCALAQGKEKYLLEKLILDATDLRKLESVLDIIAKYPEVAEALPVHPPISGEYYISSGYGFRNDPFTGERTFHSGVDLATDKGMTVHATATGLIISSGVKGGYGKRIKICHKYGYETVYAHLSFIYKETGDVVTRGQVIGFVGSTGKSSGNHLHYEVRKNGKPVKPYMIKMEDYYERGCD